MRVINPRAIPQRPAVYVDRSELLAPLTDWLTDEHSIERMALIGYSSNGSVLLGVGASTLAAEVARNARRQFEEGVLWLRVGSEARISSLHRALAQALGFDEQFASEIQGTARLRDMFSARNMLLVLDDVHSADQLAALDVIDTSGRLLVTVNERDALRGVADPSTLRSLDVPPMTDEQGIELLVGWAQRDRRTWSESERGLVEQLLTRCGRLPFSLALAGTLARAHSWAEVLSLLAEGNCDERVFQELEPAPGLRVLDAVYRGLDKRMKAQYRELGVLPGDEPVSVPALSVFWRRGREATAYVLRELDQRGLLIPGADDGRWLHELHKRYVRARDNDPEARNDRLIDAFLYDDHGQHRSLSGANSSLDQDAQAYFLRNGAGHMIRAGRLDSLGQSLGSINWLHDKLRLYGPMSVAADIAEYLRLAGSGDGSGDGAGFLRVAEVVRMASDLLASDPEQLPAQLCGRLASPSSAGDRAPVEHERTADIVADLMAQVHGLRDRAWLRPVTPTLAAPCGATIATRRAHTERITAVAWADHDGAEYGLSASLDGSLLRWSKFGQMIGQVRAPGTSGILALAVDRTRPQVAIGTQSGVIELWESLAAICVKTLVDERPADEAGRALGSPVTAVAVSADGAWLAAGTEAGEVSLWALDSGQRVCILGMHARAVTDLAFTPDGAAAVSSSDDGRLDVWQLSSRRRIARLWQRTKRTRSLALHPDGRRAVAVSAEGRLDIWDMAEARALHTLRVLGGKGRTVTLSADGRWALAGAESAWVAVIDMDAPAVIGRLWSHTRGINSVAISRDGTRGLTGADDQTVKFWSLERAARTARPPAHSGPVQAICSAGAMVVSVGADGDLAIWEPESGAQRGYCGGQPVRKPLVAFTENGRHALVSAGDHGLALWRVPEGEQMASLVGERSSLVSVAIAPECARAVAGTYDGTVLMWVPSESDERPEQRWRMPRSWATVVSVTDDGRRVLAHNEAGLWVWATESGDNLVAYQRDPASAGAVALTVDQRQVLVSAGENVRMFDVATGERVAEFFGQGGHAGPIAGLAATERYAVALSGDGRLRVWELMSGELSHTLSGDAFGIRVLLGAIESGGGDGVCYALSQSRSGAIEVWDLVGGRRLFALPHRVQILDWVADKSGGYLFTAARDGRLIAWDLSDGRRAATFKADGAVGACALSADGSRVVVGDRFGRVHILEPVAIRRSSASDR